jgi:hypothetical protein
MILSIGCLNRWQSGAERAYVLHALMILIATHRAD